MISTLYEPFRHWSKGGTVYILSDLHFDDRDCKLMDPDWITLEEQIRIMIYISGHCLFRRKYYYHTNRCMDCLGA